MYCLVYIKGVKMRISSLVVVNNAGCKCTFKGVLNIKGEYYAS